MFRDELASLLNLALVLERGDTFVDVGANLGLYSALLGRYARLWPENRWYAFEANADTAERLRETVKDLPVQVHNLALSNFMGTLNFTAGAVSGVFGVTQSASQYQFGAPVSVPCRQLDCMGLEGNRIVIEIDVEGHECEVLEGANGLLKAGPVKAVYLDEYADKGAAGAIGAVGLSDIERTHDINTEIDAAITAAQNANPSVDLSGVIDAIGNIDARVKNVVFPSQPVVSAAAAAAAAPPAQA